MLKVGRYQPQKIQSSHLKLNDIPSHWLIILSGEKLSKQELQINNTIKKLRAKEKENEVLIKKNRYEI